MCGTNNSNLFGMTGVFNYSSGNNVRRANFVNAEVLTKGMDFDAARVTPTEQELYPVSISVNSLIRIA